jgi:hypothetical protein
VLKSSLLYFLGGLPHNCLFNIWSFGTTYTSLWPSSQQLTDANLGTARDYIQDDFNAKLGGTKLAPVLEAIGKAYATSTSDIIISTDGELIDIDFKRTTRFIETARMQSSGSFTQRRFFVIGIGNKVSHVNVEGIARAGGGYGEIIRDADSGGWENRIMRVLDAALTDHSYPTSIGLELEGGDITQSQTCRSRYEDLRFRYPGSSLINSG